MTGKPEDPLSFAQFLVKIAELIHNGGRQRAIGKRFFDVASLLVFITTTFHPADIPFATKLTLVVWSEVAIGLLAIGMLWLEQRFSR